MPDNSDHEPPQKPPTPDADERAQLGSDLEVLDSIRKSRETPIQLPPGVTPGRGMGYRSKDEEAADLRRQLDQMTHRAARLTGFARWALHMLKSSQRNASKKRGRRILAADHDEQLSIDEVVALVVNQNGEGLRAKELWGHLFSALESYGYAPKDTSQSSDQKDWRYEFGNSQITFGTFQNKLTKIKKSSKRR